VFPEASSAALTQVLTSGQVIDVPATELAIRDVAGDTVLMHYVLVPLGTPPRGVIMTGVDVTAEVKAERTLTRTRLLADIAAQVTDAADPAAALQCFTDALVPAVADLAAIYVLPDGPTDPAAAQIPPEVVTLSPALASLGPLPQPTPRGEPSPWDEMSRSGISLVIPVNETTLPLLAPDPEAAAWMKAAQVNSLAVLPLVVAGTLTGGMVLAAAAERTPFEDRDLPFLVDVTARAGVAINQLRTSRQHRDIALSLQRALLPTAPPTLTGMKVVARYIAGAPQVEVGGDWWAVQNLGGLRVGVGIGDVSGRGIPAAAIMGQASAAMRAAAHAERSPADVLSLVDALLTDAMGAWDAPGAAPQFATAAYLHVNPGTGNLVAANAGHLPLLIRGVDGHVRVVALPPGTPLGLGTGAYVETVVPFTTGETLVLFTDGLVESPTEDLDHGIAALSHLLAQADGEPDLDSVADRLLKGMGRRHGHGFDDVALVLLHLEPH
jgi:hypothetical protein